MKLHLGCGEKYIPGWEHVDARDFPHVKRHDLFDALDLSDSSVDLIYACHVLEHFPRAGIPGVLAEWYRVLQMGGILRVCVPDFEVNCRLYQMTGDLGLIMGQLHGRQDYPENFHFITFDYLTLSEALLGAGFGSVRRYDWRKTEHAAMDDQSQAYYPHMDKENGILRSLNLEATK